MSTDSPVEYRQVCGVVVKTFLVPTTGGYSLSWTHPLRLQGVTHCGIDHGFYIFPTAIQHSVEAVCGDSLEQSSREIPRTRTARTGQYMAMYFQHVSLAFHCTG